MAPYKEKETRFNELAGVLLAEARMGRNDSIEICGEMKTEEKEEKEGYYRQERSYSTCYRQTPLPAEIIPGKADATLENGILHIKLPKKVPTSEVETHTVKIK
jgi:HSP20 family protein